MGALRPPVGTRGGVGWMRGPCACPRRVATTRSRDEQDKHKAHTPPLIHPLSLQDGRERFLFLPGSIGKVHQDAGALPCPDLLVKVHSRPSIADLFTQSITCATGQWSELALSRSCVLSLVEPATI